MTNDEGAAIDSSFRHSVISPLRAGKLSSVSGPGEHRLLERVGEFHVVDGVEAQQDVPRAHRVWIRPFEQQSIVFDQETLERHGFVERAHHDPASRDRFGPVAEDAFPSLVR